MRGSVSTLTSTSEAVASAYSLQDYAIAEALGADAVSIGTAAMIALGDNDPK